VTVQAFSGGAGCGKTHRLMQALEDYLVASPLESGQKVLALTFMHGSRRRLDERLSRVPGLTQRYECLTIDSFAWRIYSRWRALALHLGLAVLSVTDYDHVCNAAATILQEDVVVKWVSATFPVVLVDEAQDLTPVRLRIVSALASRIDIFAAADEFQCLDEQLRPNPACAWLNDIGVVETLSTQHRTKVADLLSAAHAVRSGAVPPSARSFQIELTPNAGLAGCFASNALGWYGKGISAAIITPTFGRFATDVVEWVRTRTTKTYRNGPYPINCEKSDNQTLVDFLAQLQTPESASLIEMDTAVRLVGIPHVAGDVSRWLDTQRQALGREVVTRAEIEAVVRRSFSNRKRFSQYAGKGVRAMTVHGAKNREFGLVIVLWPAAIGGSADQRRRLLYNAITRAKYRCLVLVQAQSALSQPPFT